MAILVAHFVSQTDHRPHADPPSTGRASDRLRLHPHSGGGGATGHRNPERAPHYTIAKADHYTILLRHNPEAIRDADLTARCGLQARAGMPPTAAVSRSVGGVGVALRLSSIVFPVRTLPVTAPTSFRIHQGRALQQLRQCHLRRSIGLLAHQAKGSGCSLGPSSRPKTRSALGRSAERTLCLTRLMRQLGTRGLVSSSAPGSATALQWTVL
jgi:hypothetical protein